MTITGPTATPGVQQPGSADLGDLRSALQALDYHGSLFFRRAEERVRIALPDRTSDSAARPAPPRSGENDLALAEEGP